MKKLFVIIVSLAMLSSCAFAATDLRNLPTFCESYMQLSRVVDVEPIIPSCLVMNDSVFNNRYYVTTAGGNLSLDENLNIKAWSMPYFRYKNGALVSREYKALVTAMTVLEELVYPDETYASFAYDLTFEVWNKHITSNLFDTSTINRLKSGEVIPLYTSNYQYSAKYWEYEEKDGTLLAYIDIIAEAIE